MKFNIAPGMIIFVLGFCGLTFCLIDNSGEIGGKVPIALFFIVIMIIGILLHLTPKETVDGVFGEVEKPRGFG